MLDALKVLFILTGASTYLVTKYVKVDNKNSSLSKMRIRVKDTSIGKTHLLNIDSISNASLDDIVDINSIDERVKNYNNDAERGDANFDDIIEVESDGSSSSARTDDELNSNKRQHNTMNNNDDETNADNDGDNRNKHYIEVVRPLYVITVTEEDDKDLPKLLLQVSAPNNRIAATPSSSSSSSNSNRNNNSGSATTTAANSVVGVILNSLNTNNGDIVALSKLFFINSTTGELFLIRPLDRDLPNGNPKWKFSINAKFVNSTKFLAFADVIINVRDINDNKPFFAQTVYHANITENNAIGEIVATVSATDYDEVSSRSGNGRITYSIVDNHAEDNSVNSHNSNGMPLFGIDSSSGIISTLVCCIDRETTPQFVLWVIATDDGALSGSAQVVITVEDQNDCRPRFHTRNRTVEIDDLFSDGSDEEEICVLYVIDDDLLDSNQLAFEIVNCANCADSDPIYFFVVANSDGSGSLMARNANLLNGYSYSSGFVQQSVIQYYLTISVTDINDTSDDTRKDYTYIRVIVNNTNNNNFINNARLSRVKLLDNSDADNNHNNNNNHSISSSVGDTANQCNHCHNGGSCVITSYGIGFKCLCAQHFTGLLCDRSVESGGIGLIEFANRNALVCGVLIGALNVFVMISSFILYTRHRSKAINARNNCSATSEKFEEDVENDDNNDDDDEQEKQRIKAANVGNSVTTMNGIPNGMIANKNKMNDSICVVTGGTPTMTAITGNQLITENVCCDGKFIVVIEGMDENNMVAKQLQFQQQQQQQEFNEEYDIKDEQHYENQLKNDLTFSCYGCDESATEDATHSIISIKPDVVIGCAHLFDSGNSGTNTTASSSSTSSCSTIKHVFIREDQQNRNRVQLCNNRSVNTVYNEFVISDDIIT